MPIAPRFHIEHMHTLALQIKRAPSAVRLMQIKAAEKLVSEVTDEILYPLDYVVYRITKYRGDQIEQPMLLGSALIGDLVSTIAIVSRTLDLPADASLTVDETANRLGVSTRTISRLRREGLVFRWVMETSGRRRLGCELHLLKKFEEMHEHRIRDASVFSRLTVAEQKQIVEAASGYSGSGRSLSDVAAELSISSGRGHETIRVLLGQSQKIKSEFSKPPPLSRRDARVIERAIQKGVPWISIANRYQRTVSSLRKVVARLRATRLKRLEITFVEFDVFKRNDAEEIILNTKQARQVSSLMLQFNPLELHAVDEVLSESDEIAIVSAMHLIRRRAKLFIQELDYVPKEALLDRIETDLRWSFLLHQRLIIHSLPAAIAVAVQHAGRPLQELPSSRVLVLMQDVFRIVAEVCGNLDPSKGQKASRTPASMLDRHFSSSHPSRVHDRAAAHHLPPVFTCPLHEVIIGSAYMPKEHLPNLVEESLPVLANLLALRFGWHDHPRTVIEVASEIGRTPLWVKRQLRSCPNRY